jgi:hypothetical protein
LALAGISCKREIEASTRIRLLLWASAEIIQKWVIRKYAQSVEILEHLLPICVITSKSDNLRTKYFAYAMRYYIFSLQGVCVCVCETFFSEILSRVSDKIWGLDW